MATRRREKRRAEGAGRVVEALPALSLLTEVPSFEELHPSEGQTRAFDEMARRIRAEGDVDEEELELGCVVRLDRGYPAVVTATGIMRAEFAAQLTKGDFSRVAVGDWLCVRRPSGHDMALIQGILPRESDIARWRGGARGERQTLAANVDVVLVVQALSNTVVACDRLARSAVIARDCGAEVAFVFTKVDRASAEVLAEDLQVVKDVLGDVPVAVTCGVLGPGVDLADHCSVAASHGALWGTEGVQELVPDGVIAIMLGESGAGKSTLLNALLGRTVLETGAVRARDDVGRHTTVARRMVSLPGAGIVVDEPGLRSLPILGHEKGLALVFPDISGAARGCRFRDCTHTHEPGCEVRNAFEDGLFPARRLDAYLSLAREMRESATSIDPDIVI